jgi:hypothetical protein
MSETVEKILKSNRRGELERKYNMVGCALDSAGSENTSEIIYECKHFGSHK